MTPKTLFPELTEGQWKLLYQELKKVLPEMPDERWNGLIRSGYGMALSDMTRAIRIFCGVEDD